MIPTKSDNLRSNGRRQSIGQGTERNLLTYHQSVLLREDSLINVPGRAQMWQDNGTHVVMLLKRIVLQMGCSCR
jgi:hypothetical protein